MKTATNPQTGERVRLNEQTGQWEPIQQAVQPQIMQPQGGITNKIIEPIATMATSMVAEPVAGLAGLVSLPFGGAEGGAETIGSVREALTYQPRTQQGQAGLQAVSRTLEPLTKAFQAGQKALGEFGYEHGGPVGGAIGETVPTAALTALASPAVRQATGIPKLAQASKAKSLLKEATPNIETLKQTARGIYNELDDIGATVNPSRVSRLGSELTKRMAREGVDPTLHPKSTAALKRISDAQGKPLNLTELDTLRKISKDAASSIDPSDARLGSIMVNQIDDLLDDLKPKDFIKGKVAGVGEKFKDARQLWQRAKKSEMVQEAFEKAKNQASGFENGIRVQFRSLLNNKKKMRGFTPEEKAVIQNVVRGGKAENMAKALGKFGFSEGQATSMLMGSLGVAGGAAVGGPAGAVAVPLIGQVSKTLAQKLTRNNAQLTDLVIRAGKDGREVVKAYMRSVPAKQRSASELTELLLRPDVSLKGLKGSSIAKNKIAADAVFFADFMQSQEPISETIE